MKPRETPMQPVRIEAGCDKCDGTLVFDGIVLTSYPPQYPHTCDRCGWRNNLREHYPTIEYRPLPSPHRSEIHR
jgi:hypothetical protein